ncbi:LysR family transcriptional regulator [Vannielia litorea]|uniref:LysR family transcriptional regulator n=1 Tax=Vannielia litorea TaxID=1217970 RepID=UPI001C95A6EE|nr:LysR family transcriptional regulator [Vannielia litorea]MBY6154361.1 LysR family transcriptional regulator [Vannielia litorea]
MSFPLDRLALQLDWNLLRTFMVIVQERSITAAAVRLNVSQPSVSAALRRLEERLELRLVERGSGQNFTITREGEAVYRESLEIYGGVVRLNDLAAEGGRSLSGNVVVCRSSHLEMDEITPVLEEFRQQHPRVTLSIRSSSCHEVSQALQQRVASVGFCTQIDPAIQRLRAHPIQPQEFGVYCGPKHPLFRQSAVDIEALATCDVVGYEEDRMAGALSALALWRVRNGIGGKFIAAATGIIDLSELIESGTAIGCMARTHALRYGARLWQIPIQATPPVIDVFSVVDVERHMTPVETALLDHLEEAGLAARPIPRSET